MRSDRNTSRRLPARWRWWAAIVFVVVAAVTVALFWTTRDAVEDEERRILRNRAGEVGAILGTATNNIGSTLRLLGEVYAGRGESGPGFVASARSLIVGTVVSVGVAELDGDAVIVRASEGEGSVPGDPFDDERTEIARRSLIAEDLVSGVVSGAGTRLMFALGRADGLVVFQESVIAPSTPAPSTPDSPFRELNVVLYRTPVADEANVIVTTSADLPLSGNVDSRELQVGAERWLMETSPRSRLVGGQARAVPWLVLGGGIAAAVVAAAVIALLGRRHAYALALVDERTSALRAAMAELDSARETAETANRTKNEFLSRMSHELRTPLNAVLGFAQLLELDELTSMQRESVEHIVKGGTHLLNLINEVLDIARIESGDLALSPESVDVHHLATETIDLMRPLASARSIHLTVDGSSGRVYVFADRQRLKQVLLNLVSNAVKYNRHGGSVTVAAAVTAPARVRISVTDTGPGLRPEQLQRLFVPFERLDAGRTDIEGTGIGLALSKRLTQAMGGTLDVESAPGTGSTFAVELPLVEGPVERYERLNGHASPETEPIAASNGRRAVLYIEDNLANMKLLQVIVSQRTDLELIPAMQGRLGLDLARQHRPDLILLDLHLPDIGGDEVLQHLRSDEITASTPVVIVSADATPGQIQRLISAGASGYLTKPFDIRALLQTIDDLLDSRP